MLEGTETTFPDWIPTVGIPLSAACGVVFAIFLWYRVSLIHVRGGVTRSGSGREYLLEEEQQGEGEV
jgi:inorganic pyrophosphatase